VGGCSPFLIYDKPECIAIAEEILLGELLFEIGTPLGFTVRTTVRCWDLITTVKHPVMHDKLDEVCQTLSTPDEIRRSMSDAQVYLFYCSDGEKR